MASKTTPRNAPIPPPTADEGAAGAGVRDTLSVWRGKSGHAVGTVDGFPWAGRIERTPAFREPRRTLDPRRADEAPLVVSDRNRDVRPDAPQHSP